jgi:hypothetical protein
MVLKPLNLNSLIKQVAYPLSTLMRKKISLKTTLTDKELRVLGDWERISHVVASLVEYGNLVIREQGTISIETKLVTVESHAETGAGCALVSITTADNTEVETRTDRGLLSMILGIIRNHNGSVRILNQEGQAEFNIYLPLLANGA